jgi:diguanylate cyclase (GGDEF)-like protein
MRDHTWIAESSREAMGRVAGALFLIGVALTVSGVLLPHSPEADVRGFWLLAAGTAPVGLLLVSYARHVPESAYRWVMLLGSLIVTLSLYLNGERHGGPSAGNQVLYVWVALYSGYFFSRAATAVQLAAIAAMYGGVLQIIDPGPVLVTRWLITVGMVTAAAAIVHVLKRRNDQLLARLSTAARTDALTGLVNRQGFDEHLEHALASDRRTGLQTALIIADIDNFKAINDLLGHAAGDAALRAVGQTALSVARNTDTVARMGGDEFAVILPDTNAEGAYAFAERVREAVIGSNSGEPAALTMSFGIAESKTDGLHADVLTRSADRALYLAKELGRNQTVVAPGGRESVRGAAVRQVSLAPEATTVAESHG